MTGPAKVPVDWSQVHRFLRALDPAELDPVVLALFPKEEGPCIHLRFEAGEIDARAVEQLLQQHPDLSLGVVPNRSLPVPEDWGTRPEHLNRGGRPKVWGAKSDHISNCIGLFAESDGGLPLLQQEQLPARAGLPEPTLMVWSGGKSLHMYWLTQPGEQLTPDLFKRLQKRLAECLAEAAPNAGIDLALNNPNRVMRLPGGLHPSGDRCRIHGGRKQRFFRTELERILRLADPLASPHSQAPLPIKGAGNAVPLEQLLPRDLERLALDGVPQGHRDDSCFRLAVAAVVMEEEAALHGLPVEGSADEVALAFAQRCNPPLSEREALAKIASARSSPRQPDPGAAERIAYQLRLQARGARSVSGGVGGDLPSPSGGKTAAAAPQPTFEERWQALEEHAATISAAEWPWMKACAAIASKASELEIPRLTQRNFEQLLEDALRKRRPASDPILPGGTFTVSPSAWAVEGIFRHGLNLLVGQPGAGKSRLAVDVAAAWLRGVSSWLDCALQPVGDQERHALIIGTDQGLEDWAQTLIPVGLATKSGIRVKVHKRLTLYPLEAQILLDADGLNNVVRSWVDRHPGGLVIVDSLSATLPPGIDIDKAAAARPVRELVEALGDGWGILTHHMRKAAGKEGNLGVGAGSGSGQIDAAVSRVIGLSLIHKLEGGLNVPQESDPRRELLSTKRGGKTLHLVISSDEAGRWICHGSAEEMKRTERLERAISNLTESQSNVLDALESRGGWGTTRDVVEAMGETFDGQSGKAATVRKVLKRLEGLGLIESQRAGLDRTYQMIPNLPSQTSQDALKSTGSTHSKTAAQGISLARELAGDGSEPPFESLPAPEQPPRAARAAPEPSRPTAAQGSSHSSHLSSPGASRPATATRTAEEWVELALKTQELEAPTAAIDSIAPWLEAHPDRPGLTRRQISAALERLRPGRGGGGSQLTLLSA